MPMQTGEEYETIIVNAFTKLLETAKELKDKITQAATVITRFPYFMHTGNDPDPYIYYLHRRYTPVAKRIYIPRKLHIIAFLRQKIIHQRDAIPPSFMEDEERDTAFKGG